MLKITKCRDITEIEFPQPLYESEKIASATHETLGAFTVYAGLSENHAQNIKRYSLDKNDKALQENTSDYKRFGLVDYEQRYQKKPRTQIILVHDSSDEVAAFIWFGPRNLPADLEEINTQESQDIESKLYDAQGQWYTSSYRTYGVYRGARITSTFATFVLDLYRQLYPDTPMWLAVQMDNQPAIALYKKLAFTTFARDTNENEYIMNLTR